MAGFFSRLRAGRKEKPRSCYRDVVLPSVAEVFPRFSSAFSLCFSRRGLGLRSINNGERYCDFLSGGTSGRRCQRGREERREELLWDSGSSLQLPTDTELLLNVASNLTTKTNKQRQGKNILLLCCCFMRLLINIYLCCDDVKNRAQDIKWFSVRSPTASVNVWSVF